MRKIIFRGKCWFGQHKWLEGNLYIRNDKYYITPIVGDNVVFTESMRVVPETVGQFTGINDFNDVDIWEGDLLNVVIHYGQEVQYLAQVVWSGFFPSFAMLLQNNTEESDWIKCGLMEYKVVGNIYDNPEMLKMSNAK